MLVMLGFPVRVFPLRASRKSAKLNETALRSAALQRFLFEFHFIRVAIEAQEKPAATLTCLLNVSSAIDVGRDAIVNYSLITPNPRTIQRSNPE
jgi:hypothetical protein